MQRVEESLSALEKHSGNPSYHQVYTFLKCLPEEILKRPNILPNKEKTDCIDVFFDHGGYGWLTLTFNEFGKVHWEIEWPETTSGECQWKGNIQDENFGYLLKRNKF